MRLVGTIHVHVSVVQPLDVVFSALFRAILDTMANLDDYLGNQNLCKRKKWVRQGWEDISAKETMLIHSFKEYGFLVAVDGAEDTEINTMGMDNYCIQLVTVKAELQMMN